VTLYREKVEPVKRWRRGDQDSTTLNSTPLNSHSVTLTGLAASTTYYYRVKSADAASNLAVSSDNTFTPRRSSPPLLPAASPVPVP
jgi:phosphodiesterase/alkaline phosphatase D-like protein